VKDGHWTIDNSEEGIDMFYEGRKMARIYFRPDFPRYIDMEYETAFYIYI